MKSSFSLWNVLTLLALVLPMLFLAVRWPQLPATIPMHFNAAGVATGYGSRWVLVGLVGALPAALGLLLYFLPHLDPKQRLDGASANYQKLRFVVQLLLAGIALFGMRAAQLGTAAGSEKWLLAGIMLAFALLGNYLSTLKPNYFVGVRTPWTLESPSVWDRTHRLAGRLFFGAGLLGTVLILLTPQVLAIPIFLVIIVGGAVVTYAYSFLIYRQEKAA